jgi:hypothetical protein
MMVGVDVERRLSDEWTLILGVIVYDLSERWGPYEWVDFFQKQAPTEAKASGLTFHPVYTGLKSGLSWQATEKWTFSSGFTLAESIVSRVQIRYYNNDHLIEKEWVKSTHHKQFPLQVSGFVSINYSLSKRIKLGIKALQTISPIAWERSSISNLILGPQIGFKL